MTTTLDPSTSATGLEKARVELAATQWARWRAMGRAGVRMMFHDKLKMAGTLVGVVFAVVLSNQQAGTFLGLMYKNTMLIENGGADIWITPRGTEGILAVSLMTDAVLFQARTTPGVAWAEPLIYSSGQFKVEGGASQTVTLIGTRGPHYAGGPWNIVAGGRTALALPDTVILEDSERENLGNINLGSVRELNGRRVMAGGFTYGLIPFGPAYTFAEYDLARQLTGLASDQMHFGLVGVEPGADVQAVKAELSRRAPEVLILTKDEFAWSTIRYVLTKTAIGITFGTSTLFGLIVGFVIVALSMFSGVVDNVREFGTLKAIGATNGDLAKLLFVQSVTYGIMGSLVGLAVVTRVAEAMRSAKLALQMPPVMYAGTTVLMVLLCLFASLLALYRLRKVEPAMVFR